MTVGDVRQAPPAVTVSFISLGAGIDGQALEKTKAIAQRYEQKSAVQRITFNSWGHEGEVDVCVLFVDPSFSLDFITEFASEIGDNPLVTIHGAGGCVANESH